MLPTQQFDGVPSANPMPPWTPAVWTEGPDKLVADAQAQLWQDYGDTNSALGPSSSSMAIAGASQPENESEQLIDGTTPGDGPSPAPPGTEGSGTGRAAQGKPQFRVPFYRFFEHDWISPFRWIRWRWSWSPLQGKQVGPKVIVF